MICENEISFQILKPGLLNGIDVLPVNWNKLLRPDMIHITNTTKSWYHCSYHFSAVVVLVLLVARKITVVLIAELKMVELLRRMSIHGFG
jgi:hypothetical protein